MDEDIGSLARLIGPCPHCGNGRLEAVSERDSTNFFCPQCTSCWHPELDWVIRVNPTTCSDCARRSVCFAPALTGS